MNQLITVAERNFGESLIQTVDARELHSFLGNRDAFANWIADRIRQYDFVEGVDFATYLADSKKGRRAKEYDISLDMAKELSMVERNDKGKQARRYFIDCEKRAMENRPALDMRDEGQLRLVAAQLIGLVQEKDERIAELAPKADALDRISASEGSMTFTQAAKLLGVKQDAMTKWMHSRGWIYRQNGSWVAYSRLIQNGRLEYKEANYTDHSTGMKCCKPYCHLTPKGLAKLAIIFGSNLQSAA